MAVLAVIVLVGRGASGDETEGSPRHGAAAPLDLLHEGGEDSTGPRERLADLEVHRQLLRCPCDMQAGNTHMISGSKQSYLVIIHGACCSGDK